MNTAQSLLSLPALVEPGPALSPEEAMRYSRHTLIPEIGDVGQRRLRNAKVLVIGAGGLGSPAVLYLAAAGVGTLGIVDDDAVELSNLQRQVMHGVADIGRPKVESARDSIAAINPGVNVKLHQLRLDSSNALDIFADYDVILDGADNFATRYLVNDAAALLGKPYVWGSILRFDGQVSVFWDKYGPNYRDLYPEPPAAGSVPSCAEGGVFGMLCASIGAIMVTEAVKLITGTGQTLLGRLLIFDALSSRWREIGVAKDPDAPAITELVDYELLCGVPANLVSQGAANDTIDVEELRAALERRSTGEQDFLLADVRETFEHAAGAISGSVLIPLQQILSGEALAEGALADAHSSGQQIILHCKAGGRSAQALEKLKLSGFADVSHLAGGFDAWGSTLSPKSVSSAAR